jgi:hypothetical protein
MTPAPGRYAMTRWHRTDFGHPVGGIRFRTVTPVEALVASATKPAMILTYRRLPSSWPGVSGRASTRTRHPSRHAVE